MIDLIVGLDVFEADPMGQHCFLLIEQKQISVK